VLHELLNKENVVDDFLLQIPPFRTKASDTVDPRYRRAATRPVRNVNPEVSIRRLPALKQRSHRFMRSPCRQSLQFGEGRPTSVRGTASVRRGGYAAAAKCSNRTVPHRPHLATMIF
jgi:hypothetical protein